MADSLSLLEQRVREVVERLRRVTDERRALQVELEQLREQIESSEHGELPAQVTRMASVLTEAIRDLRAPIEAR